MTKTHPLPSGIGIGLRREFAAELAQRDDGPDWLEVIAENFVARGGPFTRAFDVCRERYPVGVHGVSLNLGGPDPLDRAFLAELKAWLDATGAPSFSEHLCWSKSHGHQSFDLLPLPFHEDAVRWVGRRAREVQDLLERPLLLENVSTYALMPGAEMSEGAFHRAVLEEAGCGLLLDVNNVYVSATNHGQDPRAALFELPLERVGQIHIAGHVESTTCDGASFLVDDHGAPVRDEVLELLELALAATGPVPVLLEWDTHVPALERVLDEAAAVRRRAQRALVPEVPSLAAAPAPVVLPPLVGVAP